jgi:oxaloacetate decarboxylase gamma subunit
MMAGIELMLVGMGTVFSFLTILVFCSMAMSKLLSRIVPLEDPNNMDERKLIAVISAAVSAHRNK